MFGYLLFIDNKNFLSAVAELGTIVYQSPYTHLIAIESEEDIFNQLAVFATKIERERTGRLLWRSQREHVVMAQILDGLPPAP